MNTLLQVFLELTKTPTELRPSQTTFRLIEQIIEEQGEHGIANWLVNSSPIDTPWPDIAEVVAIMIWSTSDNGAEIMKTAEAWLSKGEDERHIFIALNLDVYPFADSTRMAKVLNQIAKAYPNQADRCISLISYLLSLIDSRGND